MVKNWTWRLYPRNEIWIHQVTFLHKYITFRNPAFAFRYLKTFWTYKLTSTLVQLSTELQNVLYLKAYIFEETNLCNCTWVAVIFRKKERFQNIDFTKYDNGGFLNKIYLCFFYNLFMWTFTFQRYAALIEWVRGRDCVWAWGGGGVEGG